MLSLSSAFSVCCLIYFSEYNNYYEGEFILYRHKTLPFAVSRLCYRINCLMNDKSNSQWFMAVMTICINVVCCRGMQSIASSVSVCLSARISQKWRVQTSLNFPVVTVAWFVSDNSAKCYVLSVLWMTSFYTMEPMGWNQARRYISTKFALSAAVPVWRQTSIAFRIEFVGIW